MKKYSLSFNPLIINFRPNSELDEIFQNINTIIGTAKFTVQLDREFGMKWVFVDKPMSMLHPLYVAEVIEVVEKYETRVIVEEVKLSGELIDGKAYPIIIFSLKSGVKV